MTSRDSVHSHSVLTVNSGSSSLKFALFTLESEPRRLLDGIVDRIGSSQATLAFTEMEGQFGAPVPIDAGSHRIAAERLIDWLVSHTRDTSLAVVGHRIVHGGPLYGQPQELTSHVVEDLRRLVPFAPNHLPAELALIDAFRHARPDLTQIACFDTAFHHDLPDVARVLPIPRSYEAAGVRRYGFHGLSYAYLLQELERVAGPDASRGRVILAHLGNGVSLAALRDGRCVDTSMGFTPAGGLVMGTRPGDLDPGVVTYLVQTERLTAEQLEDLLTRRSGLLGISEMSADMRDLLAREDVDLRCRLAVAMFCYQATKWLGAFTAVLGGLDTLVFAGGIGEHSSTIRSRICDGLDFLGLRLDPARNSADASVISGNSSRVVVRVIPTNEEVMIARAAYELLSARPAVSHDTA